MAFILPELSFATGALEPYIDEQTVLIHHGKHHKGYVDNVNKLVEGTEFQNASLEEIIKKAEGGLFNNSAQVWNHTFYWQSLTPKSAGKPSGELLKAIEHSFGSFENFKEEFSKKAVSTFGSGWAWLIKGQDGKLEIMSTSNADTPIRRGKLPLLTCDVWEHAYYLKYQNRRAEYVSAWWNIVDWDAVATRLK
ncbi:MAG: superoxide dismutase [Candidatus Hydrogenedentes bacterium CG07_land_8_20_14_0_80_42_17]|nr:MAG: superoxide dismutase [Candidatus Hydrogenedentes bacterium CG1_02_42_14]PIU47338.1 MAG: superoxide dismutase [Candidatus Hydrogenedentes bacterium CG07_land_8_20_14_0_80_42_17]